MKAAMKNYTDGHSNLTNMVSNNTLKYALDSTRKASQFSEENSKVEDWIFQNPSLTEMNNVETSLFCENGKKLPDWFVLAYRAHRIPHEVADIVTQRYFISPPQVEDKPSASVYLLVEPIVRIIYTMLWKNSHTKICEQKARGNCDNYVPEPTLSQSCELEDPGTATEMYDSDVVVEEDDEESYDDEAQENLLKEDENDDKCRDLEVVGENIEVNNEVVAEVGAKIRQLRKESLKWYLRKGSRMWIKKVSQLSYEKTNALPSLSEVESMSISEKRKVFFSILKGNNLQSSILDLPGDLELILGFMIFWYQESTSSLIDIHVLSVLVCVFMFYIIDGKVGRIRTRKAFEDEEKWKAQFSIIKGDALYCHPGATVEDTLAQVSQEECFLAGHKLFKFHHMDQNVNDKYYNKKTVHAFSEYQACIYFVQLFNTLLGSPFPLLSIEHLWGGTFCYNIFYDLKKRSNPLMRVSEMLGKGSCLEKLFVMLFKQLSEILYFKKYLGTIDILEKKKISVDEKKLPDGKVSVLTNTTTDNIKKKKKRRGGRKTNKKDRKDSEKGEVSQEEEKELETCPHDKTEEEDEEVNLLDNRFARLLLNTQTS